MERGTNLMLPEELVDAIDEIAGPRGRSRYVAEAMALQVGCDRQRDDEDTLDRLLMPTEFVQPGREMAMLAGRWRAEVSARGRVLGLPDR